MTLEPKQLDTQIETFTRLLQQKSIDIDPFTKAPGFLLSIASQFKALSTFEKRHENQIDDPTSGESSPCQSDSERDSRYLMPSLDEVSDLLTNELFYDVDYSIERLKEYTEKGLTLLFEDFDPNFRKQKLLNYLRDIKVSDCFSERILGVRDSKSLYFRGSHSFLVEFTVKKPDLVYDLIKTFHTYLKTETRRGVKVGRVLDDRRKRGHWYGVIIRNLPPRVSQKEIEEQCQKDVNGSIFVGTLFRIKERYCCVIRCDYLEDAELICKRLNDFQLKDRHTYEKYVIKAHIHPLSSYKHSRQDKALFTDLLKIKEKATSQKATTADKANKRGLNELLNIFVSSKKTTTTEKTEKTHGHGHGHSHSHSHHHDTTRRRESIEEEKVAQSTLLGETDSLLKRICSTQPSNPDDKQQDNAPESGEIMPTSALSRLMMQSSTAPTETNIEKEAKVKIETEAVPDEQVETKETVEKIEGERSKEMMEMEKPNPPSFDDNINQMHYQNKLEIRKFPDRRHGERHDDNYKGSTSRSRHDKRSSSRSPYYKKPYKPKFEKGDHPHPPYQKKFFFHSNKFDQNGEERRWNNNDKEGRKPYNKHKTSKSRSRSKSKSPRGHRSKQHDHKRNKYQNESSRDSPRKSRSHNRKKRTSKSKSNSNSVTKSRSRSNRRDKHKDPKNKKEHHVSTIFAYNAKDSNSEEEPSTSPKRAKKGRDSKSKSPDRSRKHDNHRSSSKYYNQNRDRNKYHNDYQKGSYNRRDRHSSRDKSHRKSSDRKTSRRDRKSSRDYDKDRKKHRDSDKNRYKDKKRDRSRSRSIASRSKDKRSASRSVSSKSDRSSKGAKRRGSSSPSVDKPRTFQSKFDQRPPVPEIPVDKSDVSNGLQSRKD